MSSSMGRGEEGEGEGSCDNHHLIIMMSEDVLIQIFLYLPAISLLRFKSVCKSWRSIIENPFFIHLHATTTTKSGGGSSSSSSSFLFFRYCFHEEEKEEKKKRNIFTLSGDKFEVFEDLGRPSVEFEEWGERKTFYNGIVMVGCCNGIICLRDDFSNSFALWNPVLKQSRILPKPSNLLDNDLESNYVLDFVGFGFDVKTKNDYKLLLISSLAPYDETADDMNDKTKFPYARSVQVYSLSSDSWKSIDANLSVAHPDLDIKPRLTPLHLNGRYFFMAQYYIKVEEEEEEEEEEEAYSFIPSGLQPIPLIMSFDFTQEIFRTIELPYVRRTKFDPHNYADILRFGEKIALRIFLGTNMESDIWVLNEQQQQGVMEEEKSWTKFYTFRPSEIPYTPQCIVDNGEFAIMLHGSYQDGQKLLLFNLSTGETNDLHYDCDGLCEVDVYKPSLVPIGGNGATADKPICGV